VREIVILKITVFGMCAVKSGRFLQYFRRTFSILDVKEDENGDSTYLRNIGHVPPE
jgi:hypothetical protein